MAKLGESSSQIGEVVALITQIEEQTSVTQEMSRSVSEAATGVESSRVLTATMIAWRRAVTQG